MSEKVVVCIPTYNERENLPLIITRLFTANPTVHALIIDDGSPDGTGTLADEMAAADERISVLHRTEKAGLGAAYRAGFAKAIADGATLIVEMDADGSHQPEQLPLLLAKAGEADLVLGSRWVRGGSVRNWPLHRKLLSVGGNTYARFMLRVPIRDITGGYRVFRVSTLQRIDYAAVTTSGYVFQVDMAYRVLKAGLRVVEVPIEFVERELGASKMSQHIVIEAMQQVTVWGLRSLIRR
ncbi:MAG: polyprenol monophosphomannose synthase [Candidatus Nanopelagicales bacterium]